MKWIRRIILIITVAYAVLVMIMFKMYIWKTCDYDNWLFKIPDEIYEMRFQDIGYSVYTGQILVYYKDEKNELFCFGTDIFDVSEVGYYDQLKKEKYVIAKKDGKRLGIFRIK